MTTTTPTALTGTYVLDAAHTRLGFVARHAMLTKVRGAFETFDGRIHLDFTDPERSSAEVTVDVASVNTHLSRRDTHLRSSDFFDAENHPQMTFRSTAVHRLDDDRFQLAGDLTLKGHTRPVSIDFTLTGAVEDDHHGNTRAGFEGRAAVNRKDWEIDGGGKLVADDITLVLDVAVIKADTSQ